MDERNNENLPVEVKNNFLQTVQNKMPAISDGIKRIGKIVGYTALGVGALTLSAGLTVVPATLGAGALVVGAANAASLVAGVASIASLAKGASHALYKSEPSLDFQTKKGLNGEIGIYQNSLAIPSYMKGLNKIEKGELMGLQTLIGFQRSKVNLRGSKYTVDENGTKVYDQKIATTTHGINIKNLRALETLGYIKIDSEEPRKFGPVGKFIGQEYLFTERIGFGELKGIRNIAKEFKAIHDGTTTQDKKEFKKITFRLTDKDIDFEKLYERANPEKSDIVKDAASLDTPEKKKENSAFRRLRPMFVGARSKMAGVLSLSNENREKPVQVIDIAYDNYRRPYLVYGASRSFGARQDEKLRVQRAISAQRKAFDEATIVKNAGEIEYNPSKENSRNVELESKDTLKESSVKTESKSDQTREEI